MTATIPSRLAIAAYQRHISPRKGFRCAHRLVHGGDSCSQHARNQIAAGGVIAGIGAMRERFRACREAASRIRPNHAAGMVGPTSDPPESEAGEIPTASTARHWSACVDPACFECCVLLPDATTAACGVLECGTACI